MAHAATAERTCEVQQRLSCQANHFLRQVKNELERLELRDGRAKRIHQRDVLDLVLAANDLIEPPPGGEAMERLARVRKFLDHMRGGDP